MRNTLPQISPESLRNYIGIPYKVKDCWGLVRLFYEEVLNKPIGGIEYSHIDDQELIHRLVDTHRVLFKRVDAPIFGDIVLFRVFGFNAHIGIYLDDTYFLHTMKGKDSCIETYDLWAKRIEGHYRYD